MYLLPQGMYSWTPLLVYLVLGIISHTDACPRPPFVPNAIPQQSGNKVTYRCIDGFLLVDGPAVILCEANDKWSDVNFYCKAPGCSHPTLIPNARPTSTEDRYTGATVTYECNPGFTLENGPAEIICLSSGEWSKETFNCKAGIECLQCNVFVRGTTNTCDNPSFMTNCYACLKTRTKVRMHDRWGDEKFSEVTSRYCILDVSSAIYKEEGCYLQRSNGGYTERCYCYSDKCNGSGNLFISLTTVVACLIAFVTFTN